MFSGIIETTGSVKRISKAGSNREFWIQSSFAHELTPEESVSHNGACLTVEEISGDTYKVTAIDETLQKTNLGSLQEGDTINLERSLTLNKLLHGHIVQGHVDCVAVCTSATQAEGSHIFTFRFPENFRHLVVEKGSIAVNGVSLTAFNCTGNTFSVAIIPFTWEHTNFRFLSEDHLVNLEFDVIGKYVSRWMKSYPAGK